MDFQRVCEVARSILHTNKVRYQLREDLERCTDDRRTIVTLDRLSSPIGRNTPPSKPQNTSHFSCAIQRVYYVHSSLAINTNDSSPIFSVSVKALLCWSIHHLLAVFLSESPPPFAPPRPPHHLQHWKNVEQRNAPIKLEGWTTNRPERSDADPRQKSNASVCNAVAT